MAREQIAEREETSAFLRHLYYILTWLARRSSLVTEQSPRPPGSSAPAITNIVKILLMINFHHILIVKIFIIIHQSPSNTITIIIIIMKSMSTFFGPAALELVVPKLNLGFGVAGVD